MTALDLVTQALQRHEGGWRNNGKADCHCWGCGYKPKRYGEYHGEHVALDILSTLAFAPDDRLGDTHPRVLELRRQGVRPYIELD